MYNRHEISRNAFALEGKLAHSGFQRWWHSFTGVSLKNGSRRNFFLEFVLCNPEGGHAKAVFAHRKSGEQASFLMVKVGVCGEGGCQLHRFWGWDKVELEKGFPFSLSAGECFLWEGGSHGSIKVTEEEATSNRDLLSNPGEISWSLVFDKKASLSLSETSRTFMRMAEGGIWHAEGMQCDFSGDVKWKGVRYRVLPKYGSGYTDMMYGKTWSTPRIRLSCNNMSCGEDGRRCEGASLCLHESAGGRIVAALKLEDKEYLFDGFNPLSVKRSSASCSEKKYKLMWHAELRKLGARLEIDLSCNRSQMQRLRYNVSDKYRMRILAGASGNGIATLKLPGKEAIELKLKDAFCESAFPDSTKKTIRKKKTNRHNNNNINNQ